MKIAVFLFLSLLFIGAVQNISVSIKIKSKKDFVAYICVFRYVLLKTDIADVMKKSEISPQKTLSFIKQSNIFSCVTLKKLRINVGVGIKNNAFVTALTTALLANAVHAAVNAVQLIEKQNAEINIMPEYGENVFFFEADGIISLSVPVFCSCLMLYAVTNKRTERRFVRDN